MSVTSLSSRYCAKRVVDGFGRGDVNRARHTVKQRAADVEDRNVGGFRLGHALRHLIDGEDGHDDRRDLTSHVLSADRVGLAGVALGVLAQDLPAVAFQCVSRSCDEQRVDRRGGIEFDDAGDSGRRAGLLRLLHRCRDRRLLPDCTRWH